MSTLIPSDEQSADTPFYIEEEGHDPGPAVVGIPPPPEAPEICEPDSHPEYVHGSPGSPEFGNEDRPRLDIDDMELPTSQSSIDEVQSSAEVTPAEMANAHTKLASGDGEQDAETIAQTREARVAEILEANELQAINQNTLIFEYGPLHTLEHELSDFTSGLVDGPIAELVMSHVRQAIHDAVVTNLSLSKAETSEAGLVARMSALLQISTRISETTGDLLKSLENAGVPNMVALRKGLPTMVNAQRLMLEGTKKDLAPPTIGKLLFESLRRSMSPSGHDHLVGNARVHRNKELTGAVQSLKDVAGELKAHAGDANWERTQGKASIAEVGKLTKRIHGLTKGVEDQVDSLALRKGFKEVNQILSDAAAGTADPEHKGALEQACKFISDFVKQLTETLKQLFTRSSEPKAARP